MSASCSLPASGVTWRPDFTLTSSIADTSTSYPKRKSTNECSLGCFPFSTSESWNEFIQQITLKSWSLICFWDSPTWNKTVPPQYPFTVSIHTSYRSPPGLSDYQGYQDHLRFCEPNIVLSKQCLTTSSCDYSPMPHQYMHDGQSLRTPPPVVLITAMGTILEGHQLSFYKLLHLVLYLIF